MTFEEYKKDAMRTIDTRENWQSMLTTKSMGLAGEAAEYMEIVKKFLEQKVPLDKRHLALELGDVLWYFTISLELIGYSFEDIMQLNVEKRKKRYPNGFETERSINRATDDI